MAELQRLASIKGNMHTGKFDLGSARGGMSLTEKENAVRLQYEIEAARQKQRADELHRMLQAQINRQLELNEGNSNVLGYVSSKEGQLGKDAGLESGDRVNEAPYLGAGVDARKPGRRGRLHSRSRKRRAERAGRFKVKAFIPYSNMAWRP